MMWRTGLTHAGTAIGTAVATMAWMSTHKVDLYALWDQMHIAVSSVTTLVATATPFATMYMAMRKDLTEMRQKMAQAATSMDGVN